MATDKYLSLFYPFDQLDLMKKGIESTWNVSGDRTMVALTMTFMDEPMAKNMSSTGICGTLRVGCSTVQGLGLLR